MTVAKYVGRIANGTTVDELRKYVQDTKGVDVVSLEQLTTKHDAFQSYKLVIKKQDLEKIEDEEFWPKGITIRHFFGPRRQTDDGATSRQDQDNV